MTISIVSAAYDREDNDNSLVDNNINPITTDGGEARNVSDFSSKQESTKLTNDDNSRLNAYHPEEHTTTALEDGSQNPVIIKKDDNILLTNDADTIFTQATPEETTKSEQVTDIPNMYIQADTHTENIEIPQKQEQDISGFDMDELLTEKEDPLADPTIIDEDKKTLDVVQAAATGDLFNSPAVQPTIDSTIDIKQAHNDKPKASVTKKGSLIKGLGVIVGGCAAILILWFVAKTMFPLGFNGTTSDIVELDSTLIVGEDVAPEELPEHSADTRTEQEIVREELQEYTSLGTSYYQLGRDLKDRNMVRYALYVEKKSQDLIDLLASDPNMDTKDIVVYFAQFDDYLRTLKEWQEGLGLELPTANQPLPPTPNMDPTQEYNTDDLDMNTDALDGESIGSAGDIPGFNTLFPSESNDTNSRSGFEQAEPEQSELSDG